MKVQNQVKEKIEDIRSELGIDKHHAELMYKAPFKIMQESIRNQPDISPESVEDDFNYFILRHFGTFRIAEKRLALVKNRIFKNNKS